MLMRIRKCGKPPIFSAGRYSAAAAGVTITTTLIGFGLILLVVIGGLAAFRFKRA